jgi:predicted transcriptional regulator
VTLKFLEQIPAMTGGREAIMNKARELWGSPTMPEKARAKAAVVTILDAIKANLRAPLAALIDRHAQAVEDSYVLEEGDSPADGDISPAAIDWWTGLYEAQNVGFAGDAAKLLGAAAVDKWVRSDDPSEALADALLAKPIEDTARTLSVCGITQDDITALAGIGTGAEAAPASANEGGSHVAATQEPPATAETAVGGAPATRGRKRAASVEASPVTAAAQVALEVLADHVKDAEVALALGVSRSQVINYRKGTTLLSPNPDQMRALDVVFAGAISRLANAIGSLKSAISAQDLE